MSTYYDAALGGPRARFEPLAGRTEADTVIIGGGFAGLATALSLQERGRRDGLLLEAHRIGYGASGRNGGFVSGGFSLDAAVLHRQLGDEASRRLYQQSEDAVALIRRRIARYRIDCEPVDGGVIVASWFDDDATLRELQRLMHERFGRQWHWLPRDALRELLRTPRYHAGLHEREAFHFNPLKYALGAASVLHAAGVRLHEDSAARRVIRDAAGWRVHTDTGEVRAREVVVCAGGYIDGFCRPLARATLPIATFVMATEPLGARLRDAIRTDAAVFDTRFAFDYFRPLPDTRLLWGGRLSIRERAAPAIARQLHADMTRVFPQLREARVAQAWSGLMSYSRHRMPLIGRLPDGVWHATGFGGHGVAATTFAGEVLARALTGEAPIPDALRRYWRAPTFGALGLLAAQCSYWGLQARDAWRGWRDR